MGILIFSRQLSAWMDVFIFINIALRSFVSQNFRHFEPPFARTILDKAEPSVILFGLWCDLGF